MFPSAIETLARAVAREHAAHGRVFGVPEALFAPAAASPRLRCQHMGRALDNPLGVAAGPHTQLAQNLVAAYLVGSRFLELKTVQILDGIEVSKPCIDLRDLGYNCEWSQELTLERSFDQYASGFVLVHALARARGGDPDGFGFNVSVGYDLAGIRSPAVRRFLDRMRAAGDEIASRADAVRAAFRGTALAVDDLAPPERIANDVTLSTMHGCPPEEIERIGLHLIEELGVHTTVKLNPTLLGAERLRHLLHDRLGHTGVIVPDAAFAHDPSLEDVCAIVATLDRAARRAGLRFAVKLTNTLETRNVEGVLPASEPLHYMSGRALHPIAVAAASLLAERFAGAVPISLSGGVDAFNAGALLACGVRPLTVCSDLLRPGGYGRLSQYLGEVEARLDAEGVERLSLLPLDPAVLAAYAERAAADPRYGARGARPVFSTARPLPLVDCFVTPCRERCPTRQDAPGYLRAAAAGDAAGALARILRDNPLPATTGCACPQSCAAECARNLLDDPIAIREVKRWAEESARADDDEPRPSGPGQRDRSDSVGIVGAGPAGLAAAIFCRRLGCDVTVYEARTAIGGVPAAAIPSFRLPEAALARDLDRAARAGVRFEHGRALGRDLDLEALRAAHAAVLVATGAGAGRRLGVAGEDGAGVHDGIDLLERIKAGRAPDLGRSVVVVGGGNSAMDAARAVRRRLGAEGTVTVAYRRTRAEMPAADEEIEAALEEGIALEELLAPGSVRRGADGHVESLECLVMRLGDAEAGGRRRPVPVPGATRELKADAIVVAVGQGGGGEPLERCGLALTRDGRIAVDAELRTSLPGVFAAGDAVRGAATIVEAIADGKRFAEVVAALLGIRRATEGAAVAIEDVNALLAARSRRRPAIAGDPRAEAGRCLSCDALCALCVTVCPNRANVLYEADGLAQRWQTANVADWCNACGNCAAFCPSSGAPHRDKPRICLSAGAAREIADGTICLLRPDGWEIAVRAAGATIRTVTDDLPDRPADDAEGDRLRAIGGALFAAFGHLA